MKFWTILVLALIVVQVPISCQQNKKIYTKEDLQGRWAIDMRSENLSLNQVMVDSPHNVYPIRKFLGNVINGFYFYGDSCIYKPGFFDKKNKDNGMPMLVDSKTTYRIDGDTLKIWDVVKLQWQMMLIEDLNKNSILLHALDDIDRLFKYKKVDRVSNSSESYDKIIVVVITPDHLSDELYCLDKEGNYLYQKFKIKESEESNYPLNHVKLDTTQLQSIKNGFIFVNMDSLKEEYLSSQSGNKTSYFVFFLNKNEIVKVIKDDDNVSPDELQWGYVPIIYLRRQVNLKMVELSQDFDGAKEYKLLKARVFKEVKKLLGWNWDYMDKLERN